MYLIVEKTGKLLVKSSGEISDMIDYSKYKDCIFMNDKMEEFLNGNEVNVLNVKDGLNYNVKMIKEIFEVPKTEIEILQERIMQLEVAEVNRKSIEIEQKILGGNI